MFKSISNWHSSRLTAPETGRKRGGQKGHPGKTLPQSDSPDHIVEHRLDDDALCPNCGAKLEDAARPEAVARRRSRNQLTAREAVSALLDPGAAFHELGGLAVAARRRSVPLEDLEARTPADGVVTGVGAVHGVQTMVIAVDATVAAGTQGYFHHLKLDRAVAVAARRKMPIVVLPEGGGGR